MTFLHLLKIYHLSIFPSILSFASSPGALNQYWATLPVHISSPRFISSPLPCLRLPAHATTWCPPSPVFMHCDCFPFRSALQFLLPENTSSFFQSKQPSYLGLSTPDGLQQQILQPMILPRVYLLNGSTCNASTNIPLYSWQTRVFLDY